MLGVVLQSPDRNGFGGAWPELLFLFAVKCEL